MERGYSERLCMSICLLVGLLGNNPDNSEASVTKFGTHTLRHLGVLVTGSKKLKVFSFFGVFLIF